MAGKSLSEKLDDAFWAAWVERDRKQYVDLSGGLHIEMYVDESGTIHLLLWRVGQYPSLVEFRTLLNCWTSTTLPSPPPAPVKVTNTTGTNCGLATQWITPRDVRANVYGGVHHESA